MLAPAIMGGTHKPPGPKVAFWVTSKWVKSNEWREREKEERDEEEERAKVSLNNGQVNRLDQFLNIF